MSSSSRYEIGLLAAPDGRSCDEGCNDTIEAQKDQSLVSLVHVKPVTTENEFVRHSTPWCMLALELLQPFSVSLIYRISSNGSIEVSV